MQFYYGSQMPLRVLDETELWKQQEARHTVVMRALMQNLEKKYVTALNHWESVLQTTHQHVKNYIESVNRSNYELPRSFYKQILELVSFCLQESTAFIQFCRQVKTDSKAIASNDTAKVIIDHIIDESEYFIGVAQTILFAKVN